MPTDPPPGVTRGIARIERLVVTEARRQGVRPDADILDALGWLRAFARSGLYASDAAGSAPVPTTPPRGWITTGALASRLGRTDRAVRKAAANGRIPAVKIRRQWWLNPEETTWRTESG